MKDADEMYKPLIKPGIRIDGIAAETLSPGQTGKMFIKGFITSFQPEFSLTINPLMVIFSLGNAIN